MRYTKDGKIDMKYQQNNSTFDNKTVKSLLESNMTWSEMWLEFGTQMYNYDPNFKNVSNYAKKHKITSNK